MFTRFANPDRFLRLSAWLMPLAGLLAFGLLGLGAAWSLVIAPDDALQGASVKIMYVHVPAAWMALFVYATMAVASLFGYWKGHNLAHQAARLSAPFGLAMTALALVTGSIWGQATWGTWWDWDARMTSVLVLFFIYLGYIALWRSVEHEGQAARLAAILCMVGVVNLPIIKFSVDFWDTLHQPASVIRPDGPTMPAAMLLPLLVMALGYSALHVFYVCLRMRTVILERRKPAAVAPRPVTQAQAVVPAAEAG